MRARVGLGGLVVVALIVVAVIGLASRDGGKTTAKGGNASQVATAAAGAPVEEPGGPTVPAGATVIEDGLFGVKVSDNRPSDHALNVVALSCSAPNLLALRTDDETLLFWTLITSNYGCEELRRNILLSVVEEAKLNDPSALVGRKAGVRIEKLAERTETGAYNVSIYWRDGGSALFTSFKNWKGPKQ